jgi:hypothetical protein
MTPLRFTTVRHDAPKGGVRARMGRVLSVVAILVGALCVGSRVQVAEAQQNGMRLIVNAANPAALLERDFVSDAFLKKATRWPDGEAIHPLDQRVDAAVRVRFSDGVLRRSIAAVRHYWQQRIFSGRGVPPPELESDAAVIARVQRDRGAIGYVSEHADLSSVKVVSVPAH